MPSFRHIFLKLSRGPDLSLSQADYGPWTLMFDTTGIKSHFRHRTVEQVRILVDFVFKK